MKNISFTTCSFILLSLFINTIAFSSTTVEEDDTLSIAAWKEYHDPVYKFSFKYPAEWKLENDYATLKSRFDSGEIPELIWFGPTFLAYSPKLDAHAHFSPILCISFEDLSKADLEKIEKLNFLPFNGLYAAMKQSTSPASDFSNDIVVYGKFKDQTEEERFLVIYFYGIYSDLYSSDILITQILESFDNK